MFTIKLYRANNARQRILSAESFTILRDPQAPQGTAEITLHQKNPAEDRRYDIQSDVQAQLDGWPEAFEKAIIENAAGRTTEIITVQQLPNSTK